MKKNAIILNKEHMALLRRTIDTIVTREIQDYFSALNQPSSRIDLYPADNNKTHNQKDWIDYFNKIGRAMISAADIYRAGKDGSQELLEILLKGIRVGDRIVTSTHSSFDKKSLSARIIHNYGSIIRKPKEIYVSNVPPACQKKSAEELITLGGEGLPYVQALFDTNDTPSKILDILSKFPEQIHFWTPSQYSRKLKPERAVSFVYTGGYNGSPYFGSYYLFDSGNGHSRGVSPQSGRTKK
jgi:hypothetical protein